MSPAAEAGTQPGLTQPRPPQPGGTQPSRRDRLRAATSEEIIQTARRLLVASGAETLRAIAPEAMSLRAIAREMGMTAPGLYRYFGSAEELLSHVCASIFTELGGDIRRAIDAASPLLSSGGDPAGDPHTAKLTSKMIAACREFRRWSLNHPAEFSLLFGVPLPGLDDERYNIAEECALAFAGTFLDLFLELWAVQPFEVPSPGEIDPALSGQLSRYREALDIALPDGAVLIFLRCWTVLYGAVSMEVFGHLRFALDDPAPMFELTLSDLARLVGLRYPPG